MPAPATFTLERVRRRPKRPEQSLQATLVDALHRVLTEETYFFAVPNGGMRSRVEAAIFVGQGVRPGVPDLIFIHKGRAFGLELKSDAGRLNDNQRTAHEGMRAAGARVEVARTFDEAMKHLRDAGIPLRMKFWD